jgi:hypothetical protein
MAAEKATSIAKNHGKPIGSQLFAEKQQLLSKDILFFETVKLFQKCGENYWSRGTKIS